MEDDPLRFCWGSKVVTGQRKKVVDICRMNMQDFGLRIVEPLMEPLIILNQTELRITLQQVEEKQMQLEE